MSLAVLLKAVTKTPVYVLIATAAAIAPVFVTSESIAARISHNYAYTRVSAPDTSVLNTESTVAGDGSIYHTGSLQGTYDFDFDLPTDEHTNTGTSDAYVTKHNADGSYGWTVTVGGPGVLTMGRDLAFDSDGHVYLLVSFGNAGTVEFNPSGTSDSRAVDVGDSAVIKYDADGNYLWAKLTEGSGQSLVVAGPDKLFLTGNFLFTSDFNPEGPADEYTAGASGGNFLTKYGTDGSYTWTKVWGGNESHQPVNGTKMDSDDQGNLYISGDFYGEFTFNSEGTPDQRDSSGNRDFFLTKYNADGSYGWTKTWDGGNTGTNGISISRPIADSNGVYVSGSFKNTVDFNPGGSTDEHTAVGASDGFVSKYSPDGSYAWTKVIGGAVSATHLSGLALDSGGMLYVAGVFGDSVAFGETTVDFDPGPGNDFKQAVGVASSLTSFDNDGSYGGTSTIAFPADLGASKLAMSTSSQVSMDNTDNIVFRSLLTGIGDVTIDFNPGASTDNKDVAFGGLGYAWFFTKYDSDVFHHISNLPSGLKLTTTDGSKDATKYEQGIPSSSSTTLRLSSTSNQPIADIVTDMTADRDWSTVSAGTDISSGKAFVHNLTSQPGSSSSYTLYVPKLDGHDYVFICPNAQSLDEVTTDCSGGYTLSEADSNVSIVTIDAQDYFAISGLTGTGGMSTNQALADTGLNQILILLTATSALTLGAYQIRRLRA